MADAFDIREVEHPLLDAITMTSQEGDQILPHGAKSKDKRPKWFTVEAAVFAFAFVNFLNYVDRGIIAGAGTTIKGCVHSHEDCSRSIEARTCPSMINATIEDCVSCRVCNSTCGGEHIEQTGFGINTQQLGYLQSAFMVGYSIACLCIAHLVHIVRPFKIIGVSLTIWIIAVVLSGLPNIFCKDHGEGLCPYFYLMLTGRILSGIGEAAIGTTAVPYLDDRCPPHRKGIYLAIYFMTLPFGTAVGFMWGGGITKWTGNQWQWAFFGEAPFMVPFAILAFFIPDRLKSSVAEQNQGKEAPRSINSNISEKSALVPQGVTSTRSVEPPPTVWQGIWACLSKPIFLSTCFGYAAYSGVIAGLGFYGPLYIQTNRPCDSRWRFEQSEADFVFGAIIAATGFFGTAAGGWLLDRQRDKDSTNESQGIRRVLSPAWACLWEVTVGSALLVGSAFMATPTLFFAILGVGCFFIFMCTAGINLVIAWSVPVKHRPMGLALSIIILHGFGDVPSPIIIGYLADTTTPKDTLVYTLSWLSWSILLWGAAFLFSKAAIKRLPPAVVALAPNDDDSSGSGVFE